MVNKDQEILVEIDWYKEFLDKCYQKNDKINADYFKSFIDGLLFARDLIADAVIEENFKRNV